MNIPIQSQKLNIAIFASGKGSNARRIVEHANNQESSYKISTILSNRVTSGVLPYAKSQGIPSKVFSKNTFYQSKEVLEYLFDKNVEMIVLAGFLWLIPGNLITAFPRRILNIHPALLPKYGGKGMYGRHVHDAVKTNKDEESGMTIHFVNEEYDKGQMIFQAHCQLNPNDSSAQIADRVLKLEHHFYPQVVDGVASKIQSNI
jgi:phosphoribosylglycinamide formyltransferase-1